MYIFSVLLLVSLSIEYFLLFLFHIANYIYCRFDCLLLEHKANRYQKIYRPLFVVIIDVICCYFSIVVTITLCLFSIVLFYICNTLSGYCRLKSAVQVDGFVYTFIYLTGLSLLLEYFHSMF